MSRVGSLISCSAGFRSTRFQSRISGLTLCATLLRQESTGTLGTLWFPLTNRICERAAACDALLAAKCDPGSGSWDMRTLNASNREAVAVLAQAEAAGVGMLARPPLDSGMLGGDGSRAQAALESARPSFTGRPW